MTVVFAHVYGIRASLALQRQLRALACRIAALAPMASSRARAPDAGRRAAAADRRRRHRGRAHARARASSAMPIVGLRRLPRRHADEPRPRVRRWRADRSSAPSRPSSAFAATAASRRGDSPSSSGALRALAALAAAHRRTLESLGVPSRRHDRPRAGARRRHPFALRDAAVHRVQEDRERAEHELAEQWCELEHEPLFIDGGISGSERVARRRRAPSAS